MPLYLKVLLGLAGAAVVYKVATRGPSIPSSVPPLPGPYVPGAAVIPPQVEQVTVPQPSGSRP